MINLSQETEALARRLAAAESLSVEDAVHRALEERARAAGIVRQQAPRPRDMSPEAVSARRRRGDAIIDRVAAMPILDPRPVSDIVDELNAL